ncbi:long-chain fatty acid--CoA ligase [Paenibacillus sp. GCM10023252]|uniref:long-chain-fatty-acid--CoA ligase n=1 Tax=Paenibacillus sp. GCM10023252 TaxID=3252649 RepID=UPI00360F44F0
MTHEHQPWYLHYPDQVPKSYPYPRQNLAKFLTDSAERYPHHSALHFLGKEMTFEQLLEHVCRFAGGLRKLGVQKGDRVAIMLPNCPQLMIAYYASLMVGAVVVMTNPLYVQRELLHQLKDSGAKVIVTLDLLYKRASEAVSGGETAVEYTVITSVKEYLPLLKSWLYPLKAKRDGQQRKVAYGDSVLGFSALLKSSPGRTAMAAIDPEEDLALLQYTGGTTGVAKGVMLTHANVIANTVQNSLWAYQSVEGGERYLAALPFFHVFGMTVLMNQSVMLAGQLLLIPKFDGTAILETIQRLKPTIFPGAPTMYVALLNHPDVEKYDLSSIKFCVSGAASLPGEVQEKFERLTGGRLIEGYGLTEASPVTHANNIWEGRKSGSIGLPFPDTIARIVHPQTGEELPAGSMGELEVSGPQVMKGYWNNPEETGRVLRDGWLRTGDMARMDEDGYFYIMDRIKDMIIASGYNIYPREIEEVLYEHPAVLEALVMGVPDPYRGETVKAYVVRREGASLTEQELHKWCRERLAAYKVPHLYQFRDSLPKSLAGKILRRKLMEEEAEGQSESG